MILVDASYLVALLDKDEPHHALAKAFFATSQEGWISTWPAITEAMHLLKRRVNLEVALSILDALDEGELLVWNMDEGARRQIQSLMRRYSDLPMDLADATLVLLANHLGEGRILTLDQRDFGVYRWKAQKPFVDLMGADLSKKKRK